MPSANRELRTVKLETQISNSPEQASFHFTISLLRSTTFSKNSATVKSEYPHVAGQRLRYKQQLLLQGGTPG